MATIIDVFEYLDSYYRPGEPVEEMIIDIKNTFDIDAIFAGFAVYEWLRETAHAGEED